MVVNDKRDIRMKVINAERNKMSKSKKRRLEIMSNVIKPNIIWDIMLNGKKRRLEIMSNIINAKWDMMSNSKKIQCHFKKIKIISVL
jgi:hypothetical protein